MGKKKKKNDFEVSDSGLKKEVRPNRVPLGVDMAWLMHDNWLPCGKPATGGTCTCRRGDQGEVPQPLPPLPRYTTDIMPAGLPENEALERALQNSASHPPPRPPSSFNSWAAPPPPPAAPAYAPPAANWLWAILKFVVIDNEDE
ncbi:hypothetical protein QYE76_020910 [Lolium multiflorum]|uniref:Uncharacterized protein n=1 Tax=Lolium multiflorum TaxID=4521 RepID=A0AAD8VSN4_LOLMU|nr:hypothetical protein QYE76_020910 [Lolium multiflorum]